MPRLCADKLCEKSLGISDEILLVFSDILFYRRQIPLREGFSQNNVFTGSFKYCQSKYEAASVNLFYPFSRLGMSVTT